MQPQYIFIHDALDELITCGETDIPAAGLRVKVNRLRKIVPGKGITGFAEQFQVEIGLELGLVLQSLTASCRYFILAYWKCIVTLNCVYSF